ncbi:hypothetical protein ACLOJK_004653 [Asimina triloba]
MIEGELIGDALKKDLIEHGIISTEHISKAEQELTLVDPSEKVIGEEMKVGDVAEEELLTSLVDLMIVTQKVKAIDVHKSGVRKP